MPSYLLVSEEDPLVLDGSIDAASELQMKHDSDSLDDYEQTLHAEHSDLDESTGIIRIKLKDFSHGGDTWTVNATHDSGNVSWSRGSDHAYYDFGPMSSELDVDITANTTSQSKQRVAKIKTKPIDAQPDHPG